MTPYHPRPLNHKPITRTPVSRDMLIYFGDSWQVCYQARGSKEGKKITAWVYGPESRFFCEVGDETYRVDLPIPMMTPFFDDQFNFTIVEIDDKGIRIDRLAGANNISVAIAAYETALTKTNRKIEMREGMRVVYRSDEDR